MNPRTWTFETDVNVRVVGTARRLDYNIPVFGVRFEISKSTVDCLGPNSNYQSRPEHFLCQLTVPMCNYVVQETAYQHSCHMLSTINVIHPDVIPVVAPEIASKLRCLSQPAIHGGPINLVSVEIRLDVKLCLWYADALDWAIPTRERESLDSRQLQPVVSAGGLFGSSSSDEVDEFLRSSRAQAWDPRTQCAICLECLGGDEEEKDMEEEAAAISLPSCSHLFHGACIRKWFEVNDTCPLCRTTVNVHT